MALALALALVTLLAALRVVVLLREVVGTGVRATSEGDWNGHGKVCMQVASSACFFALNVSLVACGAALVLGRSVVFCANSAVGGFVWLARRRVLGRAGPANGVSAVLLSARVQRTSVWRSTSYRGRLLMWTLWGCRRGRSPRMLQ